MTTNYYNQEASNLIKRYDNANMSALHKLLLKHIPRNSNVLDIGFGSSRDLQYLYDNNYNIWGIDPSYKFIQNARQRFPDIKEQFFEASVPFNKESLGLHVEFDAVITIAMWMHLKHLQYADVIDSIVSIAKDTSTIIISYSKGSRIDDERYFADVNLESITKLFTDRGFSLIDSIETRDSLDRNTLTWVTVVFIRNNIS